MPWPFYSTPIDESLDSLFKLAQLTNSKLDSLLAREADTHLPFIDRITLTKGKTEYVYVRTDGTQGLDDIARSGWIKNDGAGYIDVVISDYRGNSRKLRLYSGEEHTFAHEDKVAIDQLAIDTDINNTVVRVYFTR